MPPPRHSDRYLFSVARTSRRQSKSSKGLTSTNPIFRKPLSFIACYFSVFPRCFFLEKSTRLLVSKERGKRHAREERETFVKSERKKLSAATCGPHHSTYSAMDRPACLQMMSNTHFSDTVRSPPAIPPIRTAADPADEATFALQSFRSCAIVPGDGLASLLT